MNVNPNFSQTIAIITEQDLSDILNYTRSEDITDEDMTSALVCATVRVDELSGGVIIPNLQTFTQETQQKVKIATCLLAQYYLKGGYSWLRGSTSLNAGQISVSQAFPDEPDYVLPQIKILLQITEENLYKPTYSYQNKYSDKGYDLNLVDWYPESTITFQQADRMFLRPNNIKSSDKSVDIKFSQPIKGEPTVDLKVSVSDVNKYKSDKQTVNIDSNNVISAYAVKEGNLQLTATHINNQLEQKATIEQLNKKIDLDFKNSDLQDLVSEDYHNALTVSVNDKKLYVGYKDLPNAPGTYYGDNTSIKINNKNVISAYGVHITENEVLTGDDIANNFETITTKVNNLDIEIGNLDKDIETNKTTITELKTTVGKNTTDIGDRLKYEEIDDNSIIKAPSSGKYYCYGLSTPDAQQYWTIDDINTIIDDKIKDAISKIEFPKWKIVLNPADFVFTDDKEIKFTYKAKSNALYSIYNPLIRASSGFGMATFISNPVPFNELLYQSNFLGIQNDNVFYMYLGALATKNSYRMTLFSKDGPIEVEDDSRTFYLLELENAIDPIPVPPSKILNKRDDFNYIKQYFFKIKGNT